MRPAPAAPLALVAALAAAPARAGAPGEGASGERRSAITEGRAGGDPALCAFARHGAIFCSGTLVTPHAVLTAAHCLPELAASEARVYFGEGPPGGESSAVLAVRAHPGYDPETRRHDVALVFLERPPPSLPLLPALFEGPADALRAGAALRVAGFGLDGRSEGAHTARREGDARLASVDDVAITLSPGPSQTCFGDSGGPAFLEVDGAERLVGVTSSGDRACASYGRSTRVDAHLDDFLRPALAAAEGGLTRAGEACLYDAGCESGVCRADRRDPRAHFCSTPCASDDACGLGMRCGAAPLAGLGWCVPRGFAPGSEGAGCASDEACASGLCAAEGAERVCRERCVPGVLACDAGDCTPDASGPARFACRPAPGDGCSLGPARGGGPSALAWLACLAAIAAASRRLGRP